MIFAKLRFLKGIQMVNFKNKYINVLCQELQKPCLSKSQGGVGVQHGGIPKTKAFS